VEDQATSIPSPTETAEELDPTIKAAVTERDVTESLSPEPEERNSVLKPGSVERVTIEAAEDSPTLVGTLYTPQSPPPWPGVLLLHMLGSNRQAWEDVAPEIAAGGYAALAVDMRGHGETGGNLDWGKAADDLQHVWRYLAAIPDIDEGRTAVIGASIGGNMSLITGAAEPLIRTVVLLSPGLDYRGVTTEDVIQTYGDRPILIVASQDDLYAAQSSQTLSELALGVAELQLYQGAGHGTNMFRAEPGLISVILDWLNQYL
jgi:dienelactone hydrolase